MAVDGAELANLALAPGRACLVDIRSPTDRAVGVGEGVGIFVCEVEPRVASLARGRWDARNRDWERTVGTVSNEDRSNWN